LHRFSAVVACRRMKRLIHSILLLGLCGTLCSIAGEPKVTGKDASAQSASAGQPQAVPPPTQVKKQKAGNKQRHVKRSKHVPSASAVPTKPETISPDPIASVPDTKKQRPTTTPTPTSAAKPTVR
jgi:hypothetical protein